MYPNLLDHTKIQSSAKKCKSFPVSSLTPYSTLVSINGESITDLMAKACGEDEVLNAWDFMEIKGIGERQAARYLSGETPILNDAVLFAKLVKLTAERNDLRFLCLMLPEGFSITPSEKEYATNGSVDDEITREVVDLGQIKKHFESGDMRKALKSLGDAKQELCRLEKEIIIKG